MKVAIVHEMFVKFGGAERVVLEILKIFPRAEIFTSVFDRKKCGEFFDGEKVRTSFLQKFYKKLPFDFLRMQMPLAFESFDFSKFDLVISSSSAFAHGVLTNCETRHICYCHSPARFLWDWHFEILREKSGFWKKLIFKNWARKMRIWDFCAAARPDVILANSQNVQNRISKFWRQKSEIIFPPVNIERFSPTQKHGDYFLIVSALQKFKKIEIAVRAFSKMPQRKLVVIGDGSELNFLKSIATKNIEFLGRKSDAVVDEYLHAARGFIFTANDDFGIAPVEAFAAGKPVLAFKKGGALETIKEFENGVFFENPSVESFLDGLTKFFENEENFDARKIAKTAEKFSAENFRKNFSAAVESCRI